MRTYWWMATAAALVLFGLSPAIGQQQGDADEGAAATAEQGQTEREEAGAQEQEAGENDQAEDAQATPPGRPTRDDAREDQARDDQARDDQAGDDQAGDDQARDEQRDQPGEQGEEGQDQETQPGGSEPSLGVMLTPSRGAGVFVRQVIPNSPAAQAGLQAGDYLLSIEGQELESPEQASELISNMKVGDQVQVELWRNGREQQLQATLVEARSVNFRQAQQDQGRRGDQPQGGRSQAGQQAWLGVIFEDPQGQATIRQVHEESPAARAGIRAGDQIVSVAGEQVDSAQGVAQAIGQAQPGEEVKITVRRDGEEKELTAQLGDRSEFFAGEEFGPQGGFGPGGFGPPGGGFEPGFRGPGGMMQQQRMEQMMQQLLQEIRALRQELNAQGRATGDRGGVPGRRQPGATDPTRQPARGDGAGEAGGATGEGDEGVPPPPGGAGAPGADPGS